MSSLLKNSIILTLSVFNITVFAQSASTFYLFENKREGYNVYRIPAMIMTKSGRLLAFCEGRKNLFDGGNIDLVMKSSDDNGNTWSKLKVIWNEGENTCGNPCPVLDITTGNIILTATLNNDKVFVLSSGDEGETWDIPRDITKEVKPDDWKWYASGPVHAIQLNDEKYKHRIVVPCNHTVKGSDRHLSHVIYSDDSGRSWHTGGSVSDDKTDECTVVELTDGSLLLNMRNNDRIASLRKVSFSKDGGLTWSAVACDSLLTEPVCQGALLRYTSEPPTLLFANPHHPSKRKNLTISMSYDDGISWTQQVVIHKGKSAYNDLAVLKNGNVICIYETGKLLPYSGIALQTIDASHFYRK
jgi:sialidase-1